jgi:hypothetical protein
MNMKVSGFLFVLLAAMLFTLSTQAQEETPLIEGPDPAHRDLNFNEDKTLIYDHVSLPAISRDSTQAIIPKVLSKAVKPELHKEAQKNHNQEDALGFNFLYYMIQKFKLSDMIDQH